MKTYLHLLCLTFLTLIFSCHAGGRGIVIACNDHYLQFAIPHLTVLRGAFGCELPIEIWHAGDELTSLSKKRLEMFSPIAFRDISIEHGKKPPEFYRGWQIKGIVLAYTSFDEVMIIDADVCLFQTPEVLFEHPKYKETGAYLFRDQGWSTQGGVKVVDEQRKYNDSYYFKRKDYLQSVIQTPSKWLPEEWRHYWDKEIMPTKSVCLGIEHGESGCVLIDRKMHEKGIERIVELNMNYKETYKLFYGDKETYWLAFEIENEPYYMNPVYPKTYFAKHFDPNSRIDLIQFVDGKVFYQQRCVEKPISKPQFIDTDVGIHTRDMVDFTDHYRYLTGEEEELFYRMYFQSMIGSY